MDEKRLEIMERASAVYMKYGVKSVTMDDLSKELSMSKKTIYKYFKDKNELVHSIIETKVEMDRALCLNCQQQSENAIDDLISVSKLVVEHVGNINPAVFFDLQKYYPEAWQIIHKHKWEFISSMIRDNITRGIEEDIYRDDINIDILSRLYVSATESLMNAEIFPWPEFQFEQLFQEFIHFQIRGMANNSGLKYLQNRMSDGIEN